MRSPRLLIFLFMLSTVAIAVPHLAAQVLAGDTLRVGVNSSGGLIDAGFTVGLDYDRSGTGTWSGYDFLKPGTPYEFYSLGYGGQSVSAGYVSGNPLGAVTTDVSTGGRLAATTVGHYDALALKQDLTFARDSSVLNFSVKLTNTGSSTLSDVVYARGFDPDQDVYAGGDYATGNTIVSPDLVTATAPLTYWTIGLFSDSAFAHTPTISSTWPSTNPYRLLAARNDGNGDDSLNLAWNIGALSAGQSATIDFQYRVGTSPEEVAAIPEPRSFACLLALASATFVAARRCRGHQAARGWRGGLFTQT